MIPSTSACSTDIFNYSYLYTTSGSVDAWRIAIGTSQLEIFCNLPLGYNWLQVLRMLMKAPAWSFALYFPCFSDRLYYGRGHCQCYCRSACGHDGIYGFFVVLLVIVDGYHIGSGDHGCRNAMDICHSRSGLGYGRGFGALIGHHGGSGGHCYIGHGFMSIKNDPEFVKFLIYSFFVYLIYKLYYQESSYLSSANQAMR